MNYKYIVLFIITHISCAQQIDVPHYTLTALDNGMKIAYCPEAQDETVVIHISCKDAWYNNIQAGEHVVLNQMILDGGSAAYPDHALLAKIKSITQSFALDAYSIEVSCHRVHYEQVVALLLEVLTQALLPIKVFKPAVQQARQRLDHYLNDPLHGVYQQAKHSVYQDTPLAQCSLGSHAALDTLEYTTIRKAYDAHYVPQGAIMVIVGNLTKTQRDNTHTTMLTWQGSSSAISPAISRSSDRYAQDHWVALCAPSVNYMHPAYESLLLYETLLEEHIQQALKPYKIQQLNVGLLEYVSLHQGMILLSVSVLPEHTLPVLMILKNSLQDSSFVAAASLQRSYEHLARTLNNLYALPEHKARCIIGLESKGLTRNFLVQRFKKLKDLVDHPEDVIKDITPIINQPLHYIVV